jgi:hypothetical protein
MPQPDRKHRGSIACEDQRVTELIYGERVRSALDAGYSERAM